MSATMMKLDLSAPHTRYKTADGKRCAGVTTVLGSLDKSALIGWAAETEREGILSLVGELEAAGPVGLLSLRAALPSTLYHVTARDEAADLGTITHARIEAWLRGMELDPEGLPEDLYAGSVHGFERFREWWFEAGLECVATELPLVSEWWCCGGTLDVVARDPHGFLVLVDIKTTNANDSWPYPTVIGQVAAYAGIHEEVGLGRIDRIAVARVGKLPGDGGTRLWLSDARREAGLELFEGALQCYRTLAELARIGRADARGARDGAVREDTLA